MRQAAITGRRIATMAAALSLAAMIGACAERQVPVQVAPAAATPEAAALSTRAAATETTSASERDAVEGLASYYGREFEGRQTASGTIFDKEEMVAAHPSYPFGTRLRVVNLENGRSVVVEVTDRGPSKENVDEGVIIDLSQAAARSLGFVRAGRQRVRLEILSWGDGR